MPCGSLFGGTLHQDRGSGRASVFVAAVHRGVQNSTSEACVQGSVRENETKARANRASREKRKTERILRQQQGSAECARRRREQIASAGISPQQVPSGGGMPERPPAATGKERCSVGARLSSAGDAGRPGWCWLGDQTCSVSRAPSDAPSHG